jgi:hypothetical protein
LRLRVRPTGKPRSILTDWSELSKAARCESQEQWLLKVEKPNKGAVRIRETRENLDGPPVYVFAVKLKGDGREVETASTRDQFEAFMHLSDNGQVKDRYFFPVAGTDRIFEVDCFLTEEAQEARRKGYQVKGPIYHEWVKIDFEVLNLKTPIPAFPFATSRVIMEPFGHRNPEDEKIVANLYKNVWKAINPFKK